MDNYCQKCKTFLRETTDDLYCKACNHQIHIDKQAIEDTQGLIKKDLLLDD